MVSFSNHGQVEWRPRTPCPNVPEMRRTETLEVCAQHLPECNLNKKDVECFPKELTKYMKRFAPTFQRAEQLKQSKVYVRGLLSNAMRKNVEQMAFGLGRRCAACNTLSDKVPGREKQCRHIHQDLIGDILGEEDGIALIDESSTVKQGGDPVGVVRQYCGSVSMIANGHVSVYVGYVICKGYSWRDTGSCEALPANSGPKRKLQTAESFIRTEVKKHPDVSLAALCEQVQEAKGIRARRCNIR